MKLSWQVTRKVQDLMTPTDRFGEAQRGQICLWDALGHRMAFEILKPHGIWSVKPRFNKPVWDHCFELSIASAVVHDFQPGRWRQRTCLNGWWPILRRSRARSAMKRQCLTDCNEVDACQCTQMLSLSWNFQPQWSGVSMHLFSATVSAIVNHSYWYCYLTMR